MIHFESNMFNIFRIIQVLSYMHDLNSRDHTFEPSWNTWPNSRGRGHGNTARYISKWWFKPLVRHDLNFWSFNSNFSRSNISNLFWNGKPDTTPQSEMETLSPLPTNQMPVYRPCSVFFCWSPFSLFIYVFPPLTLITCAPFLCPQLPWHQPLDHIKDYFGEKIGIYFAFLGHYTTWLLVPGTLYQIKLKIQNRNCIIRNMA